MRKLNPSSRSAKGSVLAIALTSLLLFAIGEAAQASTVGYWRFENSLLDETTNNNDGSPVGDPTYSTSTPVNPVPLTGVSNTSSLALDGNGDYVAVPHSSSLNLTTAFTVEFWMNAGMVQPEPLFLVVDNSHGWVDSTGWFFQGNSTSGQLGFGIGLGGVGAGNFVQAVSTSSVLDNLWHHIAGVYDSTATGEELKLYVDGELVSMLAVGDMVTNTRNINIGASWGGGPFNRHYNGLIDELRISDMALSPNEFLAPVPVPAALPLFLGGLSLLGLLGWRRKRMAAA